MPQKLLGLTTRSLGVMIMVHGDDLGLVLPPRIAPIQVVVLYIEKSSMKADEIEAMRNKAKEIGVETLKNQASEQKLDDRSNYTGGFKMSFWELKGVRDFFLCPININRITRKINLSSNITKSYLAFQNKQVP